jgi:MinD superfamily P-loop ATPase
VEAHDTHLFLGPVFEQREEASILVPVVNQARGTGGGERAEVCQYHAIAILGEKTLAFP